MNPIFEIRRKIKEFELLTGLSPNLIVIDERTSLGIKRMLEKQIALIEFYPEVFHLPFKIDYRISGVEAHIVLN